MNVKKDKTLELLSKNTGIDESIIVSRLLKFSYKYNVIDDDPECFGLTVKELCLNVDLFVPDLYIKVFDGVIDAKSLKLFGKLIFMGDGDCPYCGGDLEPSNGEGQIYQADYDSEPYHTGEEIQTCNNCNKSI